ncbi:MULTISPECIES: outer membrane beta-barrel protein [Chryseobacterium]|uniref:outer membrane beta-barrel protein n=1 Tax=Chryseobacterium TaxID=59732 RepID=UPI001553564A|nr:MULTISPECIES: outer membrane beta-barrel protein [unclassified Chryseobacterium]MDC8105802.1 PorT family protein [Chryseobacterium sp. B21-037]MDQ1804305.1 outer membrane beta-barrel protein [Chryseobacterium sp. CKR4-1]WBV55012.1 outer membrane beta-barrel protein [Chryseobacterium daecheongense]
MKQIFSIALLSLSMFASAQISLAGKANLIFPTGSPSWKNISNTASAAIDNKGKNNVGFNIGLSLKANLPMAFFLMPELYYTTFKNEFTDPVSNTTFDVKNNRIDLPVLVGHKVLGDMLGVFIGPVASYNLAKEDTFNDFKENARDNFTVGYQFGAQLEIKKLLINARYEGAFSKDQRNFVNRVSGEEIRYDNRPNLFMVGLGYKF